MKRLLALVLAASAGVSSAVTAQKLYDRPTFVQFERAIAAAEGRPYVPSKSTRTDPTFDQMERLIRAIKAGGGGGPTGGVSRVEFELATNDLWTAYAYATNALWASKRDKDDLAVYRRVKDIWTWTALHGDPTKAETPADFLAVANSPGVMPIRYRPEVGGSGEWLYASQFWPNGNVKYFQGLGPYGHPDATNLTFTFEAYPEDGGTNWLFRFDARATRVSATDETIVDWEKDGPPHTAPVRVATTDLVNRDVDELRQAIRGISVAPGTARVLPPYLHYFRFGSSYEEDAKWYYENIDDDPGSCSARRIGDTVERNYDWHYDRSVTAVIEVDRGPGRLATLAVASVGTNLTEETVASGQWSRFYRCLPGRTLDGINEAGVMIEMNVVATNGTAWETGEASGMRDVNGRYATRWALDRFETAAVAASNIAGRAFMPRSLLRMGYALHYLVCDQDSTWLVEDGEAVRLTNAVPVMTNFRIRDGVVSGDGTERYEILTNVANQITKAWFTRAYDPATEPKWLSEFGGSEAALVYAQEQWARGDRESHRGESVAGQQWWQTVHTSVYGISNLTLRVCVQEDESKGWYDFALVGRCSLRPVVEPLVEPVVTNVVSSVITVVVDQVVTQYICPSNEVFASAVTNIPGFPVPETGDFSALALQYGTLGSSLAAIVAALAALKKNKANKPVYDSEDESMSVDTFTGALSGGDWA